MNTQNVPVAVVKYLDQATLMQIVTMADEEPWAATVWFAADNRHNLYWLSPASTRHSQDIQRNNRVCGTITLPHTYGQPWAGLQFQGIARQVPPEEMEGRFQSFAERYDAHHRLRGLLDGTDENRLYQLIPTKFVLYDEANFPVQPRQEWIPAVEEVSDAPAAAPAAPVSTAPTAEDDEPSMPEPYNPLNS